ncbi:hypothetical protein [Kribbella sp. CA-293567]|uniref:hypothetical protein n=1 Tax=Kribbella sp. CA-293567 TaxID=3002436 RepID=UPI0022DE0553|nr:hypothetical protein [Kribbella sp. CA-293567]WBQ05780.1 hypothetical protein OX958_03005 [Kribbella sp. CA-293567]
MNAINGAYAGRQIAEETNGIEKDARGWPVLHSADACDGIHPTTGRACLRGYHKGHHRDSAGTEWLED